MSFKITKTAIEGLVLLESRIFKDSRGYFFESFSYSKISEHGICADFVQDNVSSSSYGVIRGLHYQLDPFSQSKLLTVLSGKILDVAVDLRKNSATFGKHLSFEICAGQGQILCIPNGFAHGFAALEENTIIHYKCGNYYSPQHERGIVYNDPDLAIDWKIPASEAIIAERDKAFPRLRDAEMNF